MGRIKLTAALVVLLLAACGRSESVGTPAAADAKPAAEATDDATVTLTDEQAAKLGITTIVAQSVSYESAADGLGLVMSHESIAQLAADLQTAQAISRQTEATLARAQRLANTPGALGTETVETATRQVAADRAALSLAQRKLTATLGTRFPDGMLEALAKGTTLLARVTFPLGSFSGKTPKSLRVWSLDSSGPATGWSTSGVWEAPQDPGLPGRSFFAMLKPGDISEGSRVRAQAVAEGGPLGVLVPASAVAIAQGSYWCYLKKNNGVFLRTPVDTNHPIPGGYFVAKGISAGDEIVTSAVGLLLARHTNPASESAD